LQPFSDLQDISKADLQQQEDVIIDQTPGP
jgi:hypothetical protein